MRNEHFSAKQEAYTDISRKEKWQSPKSNLAAFYGHLVHIFQIISLRELNLLNGKLQNIFRQIKGNTY
jgi:hypothetical protein